MAIGVSANYILTKPNKGSGVIPSNSPQATTSLSSAKQSVPAAISSTTDSSPSSSSSAKANQPNTTSSTDLKEPFGTFISNHHPGGINPTAIASVCNTTPGANCYLKFTKGDVVKTLPEQTADTNGSTFWNWDVKTAGFTAGNWDVSAYSTLNGQTKMAKDPMQLVVSS